LAFLSVSATASKEEKMKYRSEVLKELAAAEAAFHRSSGDASLRKRYVQLLFQTGEFRKAKESLSPLIEKSRQDIEVQRLGTRLAYLTGDYGSAEKLLKRVMDSAEKDSVEYVKAVDQLALVHFQTHRFDQVKELPRPRSKTFPSPWPSGSPAASRATASSPPRL
jgi:Flp pilus assembly protein TadD